MTDVLVKISGSAHAAAIEASGVPEEERWPDPEFHRIGAGASYWYRCNERMARLILSHLEEVLGCAAFWQDETGSRERTALRQAISNVRLAFRRAGLTP